MEKKPKIWTDFGHKKLDFDIKIKKIALLILKTLSQCDECDEKLFRFA